MYQGAKATTTATATKTSLKKWSRVALNFISLIPSRLPRQMLENLFWSWILKDCIKVQEEKKKVVVLCSWCPRQNVNLGTFTLQRGQRNVQKSVMHVKTCYFANLNLLLFCLLVPVVVGYKNVPEKVNSRYFKLYIAYSNSFNSSSVGKFFWSWILKDCIKGQEKKKKVVVLCSCPRQKVKLGTFTL